MMLPPDDDQLIDKIVSLTFPLQPRIRKRPDGSRQERYKLSLREVQDELRKQGIKRSVEFIASRLEEGFNRRIVIPLVNLSDEEREAHRLAGALKEYFKVPGFVCTVPGFRKMLDPAISREERRAIHRTVIEKMTLSVAPHLDRLLAKAADAPRAADAPPYTVAWAWGWTTQVLGEVCARTDHDGPRPSPLRFQAAIGTTGPQHMGPSEANVIVHRVAPLFGAIPAEMPNEAIVTRDHYAAAISRPAVATAMQAIDYADILMSAIGCIRPGGECSDYRISRDPLVNEQATAAAYAVGATTNICTVLIDEDGGPVATDFVGVGPTYEGLLAMVRDPNRHLIIISGGDRQRMIALRSVLRGHLVTDLVTDTVTARWLLGEIKDPVV